jgi:hypothetical protein
MPAAKGSARTPLRPKSSILKLDTQSGLVKDHGECYKFLEQEVKNLLLVDAGLEHAAQSKLLEEVSPRFTEVDNALFLAPPTVDENSNLDAAPGGNDKIPSLLNNTCWDTLGQPLTEVFNEGNPSV